MKREIRRAGDFDALMRKKLALKTENNMPLIARYKDIEEYKRRFLIGAYATLRPHYRTEVPYAFWSKIYLLLSERTGAGE